MNRAARAIAACVLLLIGAGQAKAGNVLLLSTGNSAEDTAVQDLLQANGQTVTIGPTYTTYNGANANLSNYAAVLLMPNDNPNGGDMPAAGQTALMSYINAGGGLLTSEYLDWGVKQFDDYQTLRSAIPVVPTRMFTDSSSISYAMKTPNAVVDNGLPSSFAFTPGHPSQGTDTGFQPRSGATVFYGSNSFGSSAGGLIGWDYGSMGGRVISFSTVADTRELSDPNYGKLFSNAVDWLEHAGSGPGGPSVGGVPEPSSIALAGIGALVLLGYGWHRNRAC